VKNINLLLFSILFFLLVGCVYIESHEVFYPNGKSRVTIQINSKNLILTLTQAKILPPAFNSWEEYLDDYCNLLANKTNFTSTCYKKDDWFIISTFRVSSKGFALSSYEAFPFIIYELKIFQVPVPFLGDFKNIKEINLPKEGNLNYDEAYFRQLQASGLQYKYFVSVPGEIISTNHGQIIGGVLLIDPFEVATSNEKFIYIKSREINIQQLLLIILLMLFLFLFFDVVVFWALKEWAKKAQKIEEEKRKIEEQRPKFFFNKEKNEN
jgi:hypothetical protein